MFLCDIKHSKNTSNQDEFIDEIQENIKGMEEVVECLKHEPKTSNEWRMAEAARLTIEQALEVIKMVETLAQK